MSKKAILNKKSLIFLEKYLNNASPTGYEWDGQKIWMQYLKPYVDDFFTDTYGTAVAVLNPTAKYKVVIEGHADEISWYVNFISDNWGSLDGPLFIREIKVKRKHLNLIIFLLMLAVKRRKRWKN